MAGEIKSEEQTDPTFWNGYRGRLSGPARVQSYDTSIPSSNHLNGPYNGPTKTDYPGDHSLQRSWRFPEDVQTQHRASPPTLNTHHSFPSLKRPFESVDQPSYSQVPQANQDIREGGQDPDGQLRGSINQDHRFLTFGRVPDRHTITDAHGRPQSADISAQIHGMFFLSEMSTTSGETTIIQPELTCYRRNLFQISGSATIPQGPLFTVTDREKLQIVGYEVAVSAVESVDGHNIKLIVIPWKTPPPNSPEVDPTQEQEPASIPLLPPETPTPDRENVYPIAWRRLQFRIATANNGRRRELQQHFVLRVTMHATLADRSKIPICEVVTAPIVVRGRSPRNFQTRKEIPLLGSSSASRGHGPLTHPAVLAQPPNPGIPDPLKGVKVEPSKPPPFRFDSNSLPPSPLTMRQGYQVWSVTQPQAHSSTSTPTSYSPGQMVVPNYSSHSSHTEPETSHLNTLPMPQPAAEPPSRPAYNYVPPTSTPQPAHGMQMPYVDSKTYVDGNPRPSKSPRHSGPSVQQSLPPANFPGYDEHYGSHQYQSSTTENAQIAQRDYYAPPPTTMPMQAWAPAEVDHHNSTVTAPNPHPQYHHYTGAFKQEEVQPQNHYAWSTA